LPWEAFGAHSLQAIGAGRVLSVGMRGLMTPERALMPRQCSSGKSRHRDPFNFLQSLPQRAPRSTN
jgi:hypothetical protein